MEIRQALRATSAVRDFLDEPINDALLYEILDDARFAPSGGNRQAWHVTVMKDRSIRSAFAELYLDAWHDYVGHVLAGLTPFSALASEDERQLDASLRDEAVALSRPDGFAETIGDAPALLAVSVEIASLAATDRDLDRYQLVGGASVYPFVWSVLLAAHDRGLGGVLTTVATRKEPEVAALLHLPVNHALAAVVALGFPESRPSRLKRRDVSDFATLDYHDGTPFKP